MAAGSRPVPPAVTVPLFSWKEVVRGEEACSSLVLPAQAGPTHSAVCQRGGSRNPRSPPGAVRTQRPTPDRGATSMVADLGSRAASTRGAHPGYLGEH